MRPEHVLALVGTIAAPIIGTVAGIVVGAVIGGFWFVLSGIYQNSRRIVELLERQERLIK